MAAGFAHLTMVLPSTTESVFVLAEALNEPPENIELLRRNGLSRIPVTRGGMTADLIGAAIGQFLAEAPSLRNRIGLVMMVHSLPVPAPPGFDLVAACLDAHGLSDVPAVLVSGQPCAILHQAIALANDWLATAGEKVVLLVGADVPNHASERLFFGSAMGDAAIAGALVANASHHHVLATFTDTMLEAWHGEYSPPDAIGRFRDVNPAMIRSAIERCVALAGLQLSDITLICPHTPNRLIWNTVAALLRIPRDLIYDDAIANTGHLNSNDSLVHYLCAIEAGRLRPGDVALLVNPGFGGTRGCTLMRY